MRIAYPKNAASILKMERLRQHPEFIAAQLKKSGIDEALKDRTDLAALQEKEQARLHLINTQERLERKIERDILESLAVQ